MKTPTFATPSKRQHQQSRQTGLTLLELLVVFALIGLLTGLAPIAYDRMRRSADYRDLLRTLTADLRAGHQKAQAQGHDVLFTLDLSKRRYGLAGAASRPLPEHLTVKATVADQEVDPLGSVGIRFLPEGGATGGSIDVYRNATQGTRIRVDWLTGRVEQEAL